MIIADTGYVAGWFKHRPLHLRAQTRTTARKEDSYSYHGVGILAHEAEKVNILANNLMVSLGRGVVFLGPLLCIGYCRDESNVHVEVIGVLDGSHHLLQLVLEILPSLVTHHEVVFHGDGKTVPGSVTCLGEKIT